MMTITPDEDNAEHTVKLGSEPIQQRSHVQLYGELYNDIFYLYNEI